MATKQHCTSHSQGTSRRISADIISILILKELIKSHGDTKDPPGVQPSQRHRPSESQRAPHSQADHLKAIPNQKAAEQNKNVRLETIWTHKFIPQTLQSVLVVMKVATLVQVCRCSCFDQLWAQQHVLRVCGATCSQSKCLLPGNCGNVWGPHCPVSVQTPMRGVAGDA